MTSFRPLISEDTDGRMAVTLLYSASFKWHLEAPAHEELELYPASWAKQSAERSDRSVYFNWVNKSTGAKWGANLGDVRWHAI